MAASLVPRRDSQIDLGSQSALFKAVDATAASASVATADTLTLTVQTSAPEAALTVAGSLAFADGKAWSPDGYVGYAHPVLYNGAKWENVGDASGLTLLGPAAPTVNSFVASTSLLSWSEPMSLEGVARYIVEIADTSNVTDPLSQEYPPQALTAAATTLSTAAYGNGDYTVSATSERLPAANNASYDRSAFYLFNKQPGNSATYALNQNVWQTIAAPPQSVSLQMPATIMLTSYDLRLANRQDPTQMQEVEQAPTAWTVDAWTGSDWTTVDRRASVVWSYPGQVQAFSVPYRWDNWFTKYRLSVSSVNATAYGNANTVSMEYPPASLAENGIASTDLLTYDTQLANVAYGFGAYQVKSSSKISGTNNSVMAAFNKTLIGQYDAWISGGFYNAAGDTTSTELTEGYAGEWIQIVMPVAVKVTTLALSNRNYAAALRSIKRFRLYASNDGVNWDLVCDKNTDQAQWANSETRNFAVTSATTYTTYRLVINAMYWQTSSTVYVAVVGEMRLFDDNAVASENRVMLSEWRLYGASNQPYYTNTNATSLTLGSSIYPSTSNVLVRVAAVSGNGVQGAFSPPFMATRTNVTTIPTMPTISYNPGDMYGIRTKWESFVTDERTSIPPYLAGNTLAAWMTNLENQGVTVVEINLDPQNSLGNTSITPLVTNADIKKYMTQYYLPVAQQDATFMDYMKTRIANYSYTRTQRDTVQLDFLERLEALRVAGQIAGTAQFLIHQRLWFEPLRLANIDPSIDAYQNYGTASAIATKKTQFIDDMVTFINAAIARGLDKWIVGVRLGEHSNPYMDQILPILLDLAKGINNATGGWLNKKVFMSNGGGWGAQYLNLQSYLSAYTPTPTAFFSQMNNHTRYFAFCYKWMVGNGYLGGVGNYMAASANPQTPTVLYNKNSSADWVSFLGSNLGFNNLTTFIKENTVAYPSMTHVIFVGDSSDSVYQMVNNNTMALDASLTAVKTLFQNGQASMPQGGGTKAFLGRIFPNGYTPAKDTTFDTGRALLYGTNSVSTRTVQLWNNWPY